MPKVLIPGETKAERKLRKLTEKQKLHKEVPFMEVVSNHHDRIHNAFVLGNGNSRRDLDPNTFKSYGKIYGCNALYREFKPDHLIAVDTKMIREITNKNYHLENKVWTNPNRYTKEIYGLNLFNPNLGWSSGPSALNLASGHGFNHIYILGFDYTGLGKNKDIVNNIYAGTENYKRKEDKATYFGNWTRQTATCIKKYPKIRYIRVVENVESFVPDTLVGLTNLTHITVENFKKKFKII